MAEWNGSCVHRWNRLHQHLERRLGVKLAYFKVVEVQKRGALHLHVLVRVESSVRLRVSMLRALAMRHGFGHAVDLKEISSEHAAWYVAKYASKSVDERELAPFVHRGTGEFGPGKWRAWTSSRGSRSWGESMASIRQAQRDWARSRAGAADAGHGGGPTLEGADGGGDGGAGALDLNRQSYASVAVFARGVDQADTLV